jgi:hypothetical protein
VLGHWKDSVFNRNDGRENRCPGATSNGADFSCIIAADAKGIIQIFKKRRTRKTKGYVPSYALIRSPSRSASRRLPRSGVFFRHYVNTDDAFIDGAN